MSEESTGTVLLAAGANLGIAVAKSVAGVVAGSSAMLAEAAHSVGDTVNQALLLVAIRRSNRPPDREHPFGYGMERYFWSLLAAVGVFVLGAGFAAYQGISALLGEGEEGSLTWAFVVLGVAFVFEGTSLLRALWQLRQDARTSDSPALSHLRDNADPTLRAVIWEDGAALVGVLLAGAGLGLSAVTGSQVWDAVASLLIAGLLVLLAYDLGRRNMDALIGLAASPAITAEIRDRIAASAGVDQVLEVLTMRLGPDQLLVAARVDLADELSAEELEHAADRIEHELREQLPDVRHLFLDPTPGAGR